MTPRHDPFRFRHRQPAGGKRRAGHRIPSGQGEFLGRLHAVLPQNRVDVLAVFGSDVAENHRLPGGQTGFHAVFFEDRPKGGFQPQAAFILDAAVLHVDPQKPLAVALLVPADVVVGVGDIRGMRLVKRPAVVFLDLGFELFDAPIRDQVFEPGHFAVGPVAEVPLDFDDGLGHVHDLIGPDERHPLGDGGEGFLEAGVMPMPPPTSTL